MTNFAHITHYNDLKNLIKDRPEFVFKYEEETNTYVIKYNLLLANSFDHDDEECRKLLIEARGITFDAVTGEVVSRKYHKFYNIGEKKSSQIDNIDFSKTHWVMEKLDGSNISNIRYSDLPVTKAGRSDVSKMVDELFLQDNYKKFNDFCSKNNWTAQYEFCSRKQRIVIDYEEESLVLTAVRHNVTGEYVFNPDELKEIGKEYNIPVVNSYKVTNQKIEDIISEIKDSSGIEGIVIRFEDGNMYKVKSDEYIRFHNAVSRVKQEKDIVKIILNDELDDILPILSETDRKEIRDFADAVINGIEETSKNIVKFGVENYNDNQKEFAISVINKNKLYSKFVLKDREMFKDYSEETLDKVRKNVINYVLKETGSGPRLDNVRNLFGNVSFHKIVMEE